MFMLLRYGMYKTPCLAQPLIHTFFSILGLQLAADKFFICYLVVNLAGLSASSVAFCVSAGVREAAVGNLLLVVIFVVSIVRIWRDTVESLNNHDLLYSSNRLYQRCITA